MLELVAILTEKYEPGNILDFDFSFTTLEVLEKMVNIFPANAIDLHDVYEALTIIGFVPQDLEPLDFKWYFKTK